MLFLKDLKYKGIIENYNVIVNRKKLLKKQYEEMRKLTTGQGENYTVGCLLNYDFIKNHYRLIAID